MRPSVKNFIAGHITSPYHFWMYPIIQLTNELYIPTYFLVIALGYIAGMLWLVPRSKNFRLNPVIGLDLALIMMISGFIGGRLMHVVWEQPSHYLENPIEIFKFWKGGFVFYGGAALAFLSSVAWVRFKNEDFWAWSVVFTPIVPLVYGIGRVATLLSGSGFGRPTTVPWAITYPPGTEAPSGVALHPTPIYAALWAFLSVTTLLLIERWMNSGNKKVLAKIPHLGPSLFVMILLHASGRLLFEQFRGDFRGSLILGLTVSSWVSIALILISIFGLRNSIRAIVFKQ